LTSVSTGEFVTQFLIRRFVRREKKRAAHETTRTSFRDFVFLQSRNLETLLAGSSGILGLCRDYITLVNSKQNSGFTLQSSFPISERES
jgi:hypothetical protein